MRYIPRAIESELKQASLEFPVIVLTGPRQTGKSTLLRELFPHHQYVTLDLPETRRLAQEDPHLFLDSCGLNALIDEVQYVPEILPYIKVRVDADRHRCGAYILTGSQYFPLMSGLSESLAGRVSIHELFGFSMEEYGGFFIEGNEWEATFQAIHTGSYPDPLVHHVSVSRFYGSYIQTYLERDIRQLLAVHDLSLFHQFLEILASRVGSVLNLSTVVKDCGISFTTGRRWLSILESTRLVYLLQPYSRNISKRVVKSPKLYFTDTGLLSNILRYQTSETLKTSPLSGFLFENYFVNELLKYRANHGISCEYYYIRDSNQNEVDILIEVNGRHILAEVKNVKTPRKEHAYPMLRWADDFPDAERYLLTASTDEMPVTKGVISMNWRRFLLSLSDSLL